MSPTRMVSMVVGGLEGFAAVGVKPADDEEGHEEDEVDEVCHGVEAVVPTAFRHLPLLESS